MSNKWQDIDADDRHGYLVDYIVSWAKRHNITSGEAVYQSDQVQDDIHDFVIEVLQATGVIDE